MRHSSNSSNRDRNERRGSGNGSRRPRSRQGNQSQQSYNSDGHRSVKKDRPLYQSSIESGKSDVKYNLTKYQVSR